jgi:hypothetical protein
MACSIVKHRGTHLLYIFLRGQEIAQSKKARDNLDENGAPIRMRRRPGGFMIAA